MRARRGARIAIAALAVALAACSGGPADGELPVERAAVDDVAPELMLEDLDGNPVRLSDSSGKLRLIDFWATWCPPCVAEMPVFKELHETYGPRGLVIVGLSADESIDDVRAFVREHDIPWTNAMVSDEVRSEWKVAGLPQTYLVGPDGTIVKRFTTGAVPKRILIAEIEKHLPAASGSGA